MARLPDPTQLFRLDGRTAVVTGASSGLGERFARVLSAAGATIVAGARRQELLDGLVADLRSQGAEAMRCAAMSRSTRRSSRPTSSAECWR